MRIHQQLRRAVTPALLVGFGMLACTEAPTEQKTVPEGLKPAFAPGSNAGVNLDQWANGSPAPTGESWQNGNLNGNNSTYAERRAVPFRLAIEGLTTGTHTILINYDFTAGGHKAYDYLASIDATEPNALAQICAVGGGGVSSLCGTSTTGMPPAVPFEDEAFPDDPFIDLESGKSVTAAIADGAVPRNLRIYGGTITSIQMTDGDGDPVEGDGHEGPTTGNSTGQMLVTFVANGPAVLMAWSGHLAYSGFWNDPNDPDGAGEVSGAPWHMRTLNLDGGGAANQDRSIQPSAIVEAPSVSVEKTGDATSKVGDPITYNFTISNTGNTALTLVSVIDDVIGNLTTQATTAGCGTLAAGAQCSFSVQYTVQAGDPDPLVNTVTVTFNSSGGQATDTDTHSTDLFQPGVTVDKTGPASAAVGQNVTYTFTITNTSSADSPNLIIDSVIDDVIGSLATEATNAGCNTLASGASCNFTKSRTVLAGDPDPLVNTVTVHYHPSGFPNDITDSDDHSLDIVSGAFTLDKTGDALSKIGDQVTYTFTIVNTNGSTLSLFSISDTRLGNLAAAATTAGCNTIAAGATCSFSVNHTIPAGAPDPYDNTVTATYTFATSGGNVSVTQSDNHSTNLFQPSVTLDKSGPSTAAAGQTVTYSFTVTNTSSADSPNLILDTFTDDVLGDLADDAPAACDALAPGASCNFTVNHTVAAAPDPLVNTATVHYHPLNFPNDITASDNHTLDVVTGAFTIEKTGDALSKIGDQVTYTFTITNTNGSVLTLSSISDTRLGDLAAAATTAGCNTIAVGANCSFSVNHTIPAGAPDPYDNTVTATYTFATSGGNVSVTQSDNHSTNLFQPTVSLTKTSATTQAIVGQTVTYTFTVTNTSSADSPNLILATFTDNVLGDLSDDAPAACDNLAPAASCQFNATHTVAAVAPDPLVNTATVHYNPSGFPNDIADSDSYSVDIVNPSFTIAKTCTSEEPVPVGTATQWQVVVTNTGDVAIAFNVVDVQLQLNTSVTIQPGQNQSFTGSGQTSQVGGSVISNTATATGSVAGTDYQNQAQSATDTCTYGTTTRGLILPTQTTCTDFATGNPTPYTQIFANLRQNGVINNVAPGVVFYYTEVIAPAASFTIGITQTNDETGWPNLLIQQSQVVVYNANCTKRDAGTTITINQSQGTATIAITGATVGEKIIVGVKYATDSSVGQQGSKLPVMYTFGTTLNGAVQSSNTANLELVVKP